MAKIIYIPKANHDVQYIMQHILEVNGYEVHMTSSETIALDIRSVRPDLILLDHWLTKNDPEFYKKLIREPLVFHVPIILTTTDAMIGPIPETVADDVLQKPFDLEDLVAIVRQWLKKMDGK